MIVKNEEHNLPQLFKSIEGCFDEVIITDTGSTDRTVDVAKGFGASIRHYPWINDFSAARNWSFRDVKTDYVMWLDGDDVLENPQGFKDFRDVVMSLADYWVAPYHYSSNSEGKVMCTFARERVFKVDKNPEWKYFVHEGVLPSSNSKMQYTNSWAVRHMRTNEDLMKDRSRNLNIFEKNLDKLDCRMRYYYGKELFESGKHKESLPHFKLALADPKLELHDQVLAIQYACYSYTQGEDYTRAIQLAHQGLILSPNRAEFHSIIGDCYVKLNQLQNAVPYFSAAKNCVISTGPQGASAIFHHEDSYTVYPRNQLARIYANTGDLVRGEKEAQESVDTYKNGESLMILDEIKRVRLASVSFKDAKPCDDIVISCPPYAPYLWDGEIAKTQSMGGSETACIEAAYWLKKISGRSVKVFNVRGESKIVDGVEYISTEKLNEYMGKNKPYVNINWRHNFKVTDAPTLIWCHDLQTQGIEQIENYEKALCLTPFHKSYMKLTQGVPDDKIIVTRNGIKPERFSDGPWVKNPNKIVFPSSPDRGLDRCMLVLDKVREKYPDIELHVFYGIEHLHKYGLQGLADKLKSMMEERPWVKYHGATQQDVLMAHLKEAAIWLHPCDFVETSCITAMEMVCAGVYPVTRRLGGLADTLSIPEKNGMATLLDSDCITPNEFQLYIDATIKALDEKAWERVSFDANSISWESVAKEWINDIFPKLGMHKYEQKVS